MESVPTPFLHRRCRWQLLWNSSARVDRSGIPPPGGELSWPGGATRCGSSSLVLSTQANQFEKYACCPNVSVGEKHVGEKLNRSAAKTKPAVSIRLPGQENAEFTKRMPHTVILNKLMRLCSLSAAL